MRWQAIALAFGCAACVGDAALAQSSPAAAPAPVVPAANAPAYQDRLLDNAPGTASITYGEEADAGYNPDGAPRFLKLDTVLSHTEDGGPRENESGLVLSAGIETADYGALTLDATLKATGGGQSIALIQRGMPFDGGWSATNSVGTIYTPAIDLARYQYRFFLPTFTIAGISTDWVNKGVQVQASTGEPGLFTGIRLSGYNGLGGSLESAGAEWSWAPNWQFGIQGVASQDVSVSTVSQIGADNLPGLALANGLAASSAHSLFESVAWKSGTNGAQLNLVESQNGLPGIPSHATGLWLDAFNTGYGTSQNYGVFRLAPGLSWGYTPISSDSEGGYYRTSYSTRQVYLGGDFEAARSISGETPSGVQGSGSSRYQFDPANALGANLTIQRASGENAELETVFGEHRNDWGTARLQFDRTNNQGDQYSRATIDESWNTAVDLRLDTSIYVGHENDQGVPLNHVGGSLTGGGDLTSQLSWDGGLTVDSSSGGRSSNTIGANIGVSWRISPHWSLNALYFDNRDVEPNLLVLTPLVQQGAGQLITRTRAVYFTLRYEARAGSFSAPIGGVPGSGAGTLTGKVFLDANGNGVLDAGEKAVDNITVILDGRYATKTDLQGRYEFPAVAAGTHTIAVMVDNLPLPWVIDNDGKQTVIVRVRETTPVDFPAKRMKS